MYFNSLRQEKVLTVIPSGRLDGAGATELEKFLNTTDASQPFLSLVFDMREIVYLSSAGLRILAMAARKTHERGGQIALFGLQTYCQDVVRIVGMESILHCFGSALEAYAHCGVEISAETEAHPPEVEVTSGKFTFNTICADDAALVVTGDIANILHSRLENTLVHGRNLDELTYSLGFGAMGSVVADYLPLIGNMLTFDHAVLWTPADGHDSPDYLVPAEGQNQFVVQSGMNLALHGQFNEMAFFTSTASIGVELDAVWHDLLHLAGRRRPGFKGMVWASMLAEMETAYVTTLKRAPLLVNEPKNGKTIVHPSNCGDWFDTDSLPTVRNGLALINGVGADLLWDLSDYNESTMSRIFPVAPTVIGARQMLLHNHAAVFDPGKVEWQLDRFTEESRLLMGTGRLRKVGELQSRSMIKQALIGIAYISDLEMPRQLDNLYARRLDYQLNRNEALLRAYKTLDAP